MALHHAASAFIALPDANFDKARPALVDRCAHAMIVSEEDETRQPVEIKRSELRRMRVHVPTIAAWLDIAGDVMCAVIQRGEKCQRRLFLHFAHNGSSGVTVTMTSMAVQLGS